MRKSILILAAFIPLGLMAQPHDMEGAYSLEAENFYQQGLVFQQAGDLDNAAALFSEAVWADSTHLKAMYNLALVQYETGEFKKTEENLERLLRASPWDTEAYGLYGMALYQRGIYDRAIASFSAALKANEQAYLLVNRGLAYSATGQYRAAMLDFDSALLLEAGNFAACSAKGATLHKLGQSQLALNWLDKALALQPDDVASLLNRAAALFEMGEKEKAASDFNLAIALGGRSDAYLARARCLLMDEQMASALQDIRRAMCTAADNPEVYYLLGEAEMARHENQSAIESFSIALEFDASCVECYFGRSMARKKDRQFYESINDLYKVLELDPSHQAAKAMMPEIYGLLDLENTQWMAGKK
jgi:tetratricopeptide (TPR) repeat protein